MRKAILAGLISALPLAAVADWSEWRGPTSNGVSPAENVPVAWSESENVLWKLAMPNGSGATPIVHGDSIFLTGVKDGANIAFCVGLDGKQRWETKLGPAEDGKHRQKGSGSHPSPATDGEFLFVHYRSGEFVCLDMDGAVQWTKNLRDMYGRDTLYWDLGTSPVLSKDYVIVASMMDPPNSYLVAFEKASGEVAWKVDRVLPAPREAHQSYTTPVVRVEDGVEKIYVLGSDHVTAHLAESGKEIWRVGDLNTQQAGNFRSIASAVVEDDILVAPYARGRLLRAMKVDGTGDVTDSKVVWSDNDFGSDVPSPAVLDGKLYTVSDRGELACLDVKTGEALWNGDLDSNTVSASPIIADGKIYITDEQGTTYVAERGEGFKLLASNALGEYTLATPVPLDGKLLIRTYENLYCIGK